MMIHYPHIKAKEKNAIEVQTSLKAKNVVRIMKFKPFEVRSHFTPHISPTKKIIHN
jgi:hypothetical protein